LIIYFLTKEKDVCDEIASELIEKGQSAIVFTDMQKYQAAVVQEGVTRIDLLAIDFRMIDPTYLDPYKMMEESKLFIPLIFYNDPLPDADERAVFWKVQLRDRLGEYMPLTILNRVFPLFKMIQDIVNSSELNPYISVISKPLDFNNRFSNSLDNCFDIENYRKEIHIQNSRYKLFLYLYKNIGKNISAKEICNYLWNDYSEKNLKNLYTYIHDLRNAFKKERNNIFEIKHDGKEYYTLEAVSIDTTASSSKNLINYFTHKRQLLNETVCKKNVTK